MPKIQEKFDLTGRVAIVTGGIGLLGTEFCRTLAEAGAAVTVVDLNGEKCAAVAADLKRLFGSNHSAHDRPASDVNRLIIAHDQMTHFMDAGTEIDHIRSAFDRNILFRGIAEDEQWVARPGVQFHIHVRRLREREGYDVFCDGGWYFKRQRVNGGGPDG